MSAPLDTDLLSRLLDREEGLTARELARRAGLVGDDLDVERILRRNPDLFRPGRGQRPVWFLRKRAVPTTAGVAGPVDRLPPLRLWQADALRAWQGHGRRGVIEAVTGAGKTLIGVAAIRDVLAEGGGAVVLTPTTPLVGQWQQSLLELLPGVRVAAVGGGERDDVSASNVVVTTVQSAALRGRDVLPPRTPLLVVADEVHRYGAETFSRSLLSDYEQRLGLTATYTRSDDGLEQYLEGFFGPSVLALGYERALREEVISPWRATLVGVSLDADSRREYDEFDAVVAELTPLLLRSFGVVPDNGRDLLGLVTAQVRRNDGTMLTARCKTWLAAWTGYRRVLAETPSKLEVLASMAEEFRQANGALVFTESVAGAEAAARRLRRAHVPAQAIHGETDMDDRRRRLHALGSGALKAVVAPRVLDEGIDVPAADLAVIVAASRTRRQMIQRMGRILRRTTDDKVAHFVLLYARATREDPEYGAHESFLDEILPLATSVELLP